MDAIYFYEGNNVIAAVESSIVPPPSSIVMLGTVEYLVHRVTYQLVYPRLDSAQWSMVASVHVRRL